MSEIQNNDTSLDPDLQTEGMHLIYTHGRSQIWLYLEPKLPYLNLNQAVVEHLFRFLNLETLKTCRAVCKQWDFEALHTMRSRQSCYIRYNKSNQSLLCEYDSELRALRQILKKSSNPQKFFQSLNIDFRSLCHLGVKNIIEEYGTSLKKLKCRKGIINSDRDIDEATDMFWDLLVNSSPNLEHLSIEIPYMYSIYQSSIEGAYEVRPRSPQFFDLEFPEFLNLKSLKVNGMTLSTYQQFFMELLISSPKLVKLTIEGGLSGYDFTAYFLCWMTEHPKITQKLEEFSWEGPENSHSKVSMLEAMSKLQFSPNLKILRLGESSPGKCQIQHLIKLLNKVGPHLEKLYFPNDLTCCKLVQDEAYTSLSEMTQIKVLKSDYCSYGLSFLAILQKFPNLVKLELGKDEDMYDICNQNYFKKLGKVKNPPYLNLKTLILKGIRISRISILKNLTEKFPNLSSLTMRLCTAFYKKSVGSVNEISIHGVLEVLSNLKGLELLEIGFDHECSFDKVFESFVYLKDIPKLATFTIKAIGIPAKSCLSECQPRIAKKWIKYLKKTSIRLIRIAGFNSSFAFQGEINECAQKHGVNLQWNL